MPPQAIAALATARAAGITGSDYLTGHSLGGALALIAAAHLGAPAVTFNAPGIADSCLASASFRQGIRRFLDVVALCAANPRVHNVRIAGDPVSSVLTTGAQVGGRLSVLPGTSCGLDGLCRHGIRTCVEAVRRVPANYAPLTL